MFFHCDLQFLLNRESAGCATHETNIQFTLGTGQKFASSIWRISQSSHVKENLCGKDLSQWKWKYDSKFVIDLSVVWTNKYERMSIEQSFCLHCIKAVYLAFQYHDINVNVLGA